MLTSGMLITGVDATPPSLPRLVIVIVDGYDAAAMIQQIKEMLERPATIFLP